MNHNPTVRHKRVPKEEQIRLIEECRKSGLSDAEWCEQHDISVSTFYTWVKRNQNQALKNISASIERHTRRSAADGIALVKVVPEQTTVTDIPQISAGVQSSPLEVEMNGAVVRVPQNYDPLDLLKLLRVLREL